MRNVLQVIDSFDQGGSEQQAVQLTRLLFESGNYRVHVACLRNKGVLRSQLENIGFSDIPEFPLSRFYDLHALKQLRLFAKLLSDWQIDIVHTHDFYTNIFGMAAAKLAGIPVRIASRRESAKRASQKRMVERVAYKLAHSVVANCEVVRRELIAEGVSARKIVTIHNGVNYTAFSQAALSRNAALARFGLPKDQQYRFVTIVANLRPVKDYPNFLRAAAEVVQAIPDAAFLIAGDGDLLDSLRSLALELGLEQRVFFLGRCNSIIDLLTLSEVCVLSSASEGFSNSILEYMAAARPVVATDVGGAREAVLDGQTGYLVPAGNPEKMASSIISLLAEPNLARAMGKRGGLVAKEKFSCENQLHQTETLYEKLLVASRV